MKHIAVFFAEGFEEIEALSVVDICRRANIIVDMVSITDQLQVTGSHNITVTTDKLLDTVKFDELDMVVLPGGLPGAANLEASQTLMAAFDKFHQANKFIAAICAAPRIFGRRGYVSGKTACIYPGIEDELTGATVSYDEVIVDGHIITSRGMGTAIAFSLAIVEQLMGNDIATELGKKIVHHI